MNAFDQEHPVVLLNLSGHVGDQPPFAGRNFARLQRAPEGSGESPSGGRDQVVERGGVRRVLLNIYTVVISHRSVHPEQDRLGLFREKRFSERSTDPFDSDC